MIKHLWQTNRIALLAFVVALGALGFFGVRTTASMMYWMDPAHQDQALAGWMTPRYVGQSYKLPREIVMEALMMDPDAPPRRISISEIASQNNMTMDDLQQRLNTAADLFDAERDARHDD